MISDISEQNQQGSFGKIELQGVDRRTRGPGCNSFIASRVEIRYLLPFFLLNCPSRLDSYSSNVVILEDAT
jgi:hypothetical protein